MQEALSALIDFWDFQPTTKEEILEDQKERITSLLISEARYGVNTVKVKMFSAYAYLTPQLEDEITGIVAEYFRHARIGVEWERDEETKSHYLSFTIQ